ncbi:MAG: OmpA family protein [Bacteroidota bacterium]
MGRQRNRRVSLDYYQEIPFLTLTGQALDRDGRGIANASIRVHARSFTDTLQADASGRYALQLPKDTILGIDVYAKGYFLETQMVKVQPQASESLTITLPKADVGAVADIANLYFVGDMAVLLPRSEPELPRVKRFMEVNPHLKVEIAGHVNYPNTPPVPQTSDEWDLSVRRARLVYDYLLSAGIPAAQLTYQGYGNHEMRFPRARSSEQQAANRRVEIRVVGELED